MAMARQARNVSLGYGLIGPLRRAASRDFVTGEGVPLIASCLRQVIKTRKGELPWKPEFGCDLEQFRHHNAPVAVVVSEIATAIATWEPRANDVNCGFIMPAENVVMVQVQWSAVCGAQAGNNVLIPPTTTEVPL